MPSMEKSICLYGLMTLAAAFGAEHHGGLAIRIKRNRRGFSGLPLSKLNGVGQADAPQFTPRLGVCATRLKAAKSAFSMQRSIFSSNLPES